MTAAVMSSVKRHVPFRHKGERGHVCYPRRTLPPDAPGSAARRMPVPHAAADHHESHLPAAGRISIRSSHGTKRQMQHSAAGCPPERADILFQPHAARFCPQPADSERCCRVRDDSGLLNVAQGLVGIFQHHKGLAQGVWHPHRASAAHVDIHPAGSGFRQHHTV